MKITNRLIYEIAVLAIIGASYSSAQSLPATLINIDPSIAVRGTMDNGSFIQDWPSGDLKFSNFDAFCIEPNQGLSYGEALVYQIQNPLSLSATDSVARLVGGYLSYLNTATNPTATAENAAAVQWAIWEITAETLSSPSLADGNVRITSSANISTINLANQYLAQIDTYTPANVAFLTNPDRQDVVTWNTVPEPTSAGLLALSGLLCFRRRR